MIFCMLPIPRSFSLVDPDSRIIRNIPNPYSPVDLGTTVLILGTFVSPHSAYPCEIWDSHSDVADDSS
jgi:hypothetical protein